MFGNRESPKGSPQGCGRGSKFPHQGIGDGDGEGPPSPTPLPPLPVWLMGVVHSLTQGCVSTGVPPRYTIMVPMAIHEPKHMPMRIFNHAFCKNVKMTILQPRTQHATQTTLLLTPKYNNNTKQKVFSITVEGPRASNPKSYGRIKICVTYTKPHFILSYRGSS